jgi:hypothetical protein
MKEMMGKMQAENVNMEGAAILTEMTMEAVKSPAQMSGEQEKKQDSDSSEITSVRGLGGMLGRRLSRKKEPEADPNKPQNRATIMTVTHELLKVEPVVPDSDVSIPAGFKESMESGPVKDITGSRLRRVCSRFAELQHPRTIPQRGVNRRRKAPHAGTDHTERVREQRQWMHNR